MALSVYINWGYPLLDETGFLLKKSLDGVIFDINIPTPASPMSYTDEDVTIGNFYWYSIAATNSYGTGTFSNTASVFISSSEPITLSLTVTATPDSKPYDGNSSSVQLPTITGSLIPGDTSNFSQSFSGIYVGDQNVTPVGTVIVTSGNAYEVTLIDNFGVILGPDTSSILDKYIVMPCDTNVLQNEGWTIDIESIASGSNGFMVQDYLSADDVMYILTSSNCISWSAVSSMSAFSSIANFPYCRVSACGNNRYVMIGQVGPDYNFDNQWAAYSDDGGLTWNTSSVPATNLLFDLIWDGTKFVGVGQSNNVVTSSDAINWWLGTGPDDLLRISYDGIGRYVAANTGMGSEVKDVLYTTTDLINWQAVSSSNTPSGRGYCDVAFSPSLSLWMAVGENVLVATSPDGVNWTDHSNPLILPENTNIVAISRNNNDGRFAVAAGSYLFTTPDGVNWDLQKIDPYFNYFGNDYSYITRLTYEKSVDCTVIFGVAPPT